MSLCVFIAGKSAACLAGLLFSLSWTHSVERTEWVEHWQLKDEQLVLKETFVKGSGAGIDPAPNAVLENGWYRWAPESPLTVPAISLANSELTPDNWRLCALDSVTRETSKCIDFAKFEDRGVELFTIQASR
ncbi:DUF1850 domain-containing protein [Limnobacter sp.]|jgi:hypothetical protein|uniref:DUF1850 domain-containing protein n=1 Tax=Limnobacter sp. TaxID=2003368 RepID=UPI0027336F7F|nr:DUF1850 domain-containing protein [Limnobacter sp.]MDP3270863.1 DUF1850 domain-containing protein [Limnobacter sp.]MDZ4051501.1 DUF1850 domain-containing protein [Limnobacter sp.]